MVGKRKQKKYSDKKGKHLRTLTWTIVYQTQKQWKTKLYNEITNITNII